MGAQCWTLRQRAQQISYLDQKYACPVPLTASNVKMSHLYFSCYQKTPDYQWPEEPAFQRERGEPV